MELEESAHAPLCTPMHPHATLEDFNFPSHFAMLIADVGMNKYLSLFYFRGDAVFWDCKRSW